jgi:PAS domain S-box-containing protein
MPLSVNDKLCEITGFTRAELVARSFRDITYPDELALGAAMKAPLLAGETTAGTIEKRYRRKDGGLVWVRITMSLLCYPDGKPEFVGIFEDITERKRIEEELRQATSLLRAIGTCSPDPIFAKDTASRFLFANPATLAPIGKSAEELIGRTNLEWHANTEQAAAVIANDRRIIETGQAEILEETFDGARQSTRILRAAKAPLPLEDGSIIGAVSVSSDITAVKQTEASLRQLSAELEARVCDEVRARRRQDILMAELDHRVKNMLANIQALIGPEPHRRRHAGWVPGELRGAIAHHEPDAQPVRWTPSAGQESG